MELPLLCYSHPSCTHSHLTILSGTHPYLAYIPFGIIIIPSGISYILHSPSADTKPRLVFTLNWHSNYCFPDIYFKKVINKTVGLIFNVFLVFLRAWVFLVCFGAFEIIWPFFHTTFQHVLVLLVRFGAAASKIPIKQPCLPSPLLKFESFLL